MVVTVGHQSEPRLEPRIVDPKISHLLLNVFHGRLSFCVGRVHVGNHAAAWIRLVIVCFDDAGERGQRRARTGSPGVVGIVGEQPHVGQTTVVPPTAFEQQTHGVDAVVGSLAKPLAHKPCVANGREGLPLVQVVECMMHDRLDDATLSVKRDARIPGGVVAWTEGTK
eukprot:7387668-Prymnesium_polylepis.1